MHRQNQTPNHNFNLSNVFILHVSAMWTLAVSEKVPEKRIPLQHLKVVESHVLVYSVLWRSVIAVYQKKTQDSFQELFLVLGDASFDLYPGCHFLEINAACTIQTH